jgi:hypothetical protein
VIDRALEFRREDRYESATAMREDVKRAIAEIDAGAPDARPPPSSRLPPPRRQAPTQPRAAPPPEPTIEVSERDIVRAPAYGMDESIRIPKNGSLLPWLALLVVGGAGVYAWREPSHGLRQVESLKAWGHSLLAPPAPTASAAAAQVPSASADPTARTAVDAGTSHAAATGSAKRPRPSSH